MITSMEHFLRVRYVPEMVGRVGRKALIVLRFACEHRPRKRNWNSRTKMLDHTRQLRVNLALVVRAVLASP